MTDFMPESTFAASSGMAKMVWGTDSDAPPPPPRPEREARSAASLAAATNQLLEAMVERRVPRLEHARRKLQNTRASTDLTEIDTAVKQLQAETAALDFLAGRSGGDRSPEFLQQGASLAAAAERFGAASSFFTNQHLTHGSVARLLWIELVLEGDSLRKRVRQGARWLAQMDRDLVARRAAATADITHRALEELGRRGQNLHERLHTVHRLCGHARGVHALCEQLAEQRTNFCQTLQVRVAPASQALQQALQPLLEAAGYRPLVPEELISVIEARHALQVFLAQAAAEIVRLHGGDRELAAQLAWMEAKAGSLS
jgi:hypothetical protein